MNELDLFRFLNEDNLEFRWVDDMLLVWIDNWCLKDFTTMVKSSLDDGGVECRLQTGGVVCVDIAPICEYYGIDPERILPKVSV